MTRPMFEASDKIIEGTFSEPINVEAVCRAINEDPECLKNAEITNGDGSLKLRNGDLVFLEILREKLKNKKSVGRVVTDAVLEVYVEEHQDEGEEVLKVALEKYDEYYVKNLAEDQGAKRNSTKMIPVEKTKPVKPEAKTEDETSGSWLDIFKGDGLKPVEVPWVESLTSAPIRPFMILTERGRDAMKRLSNENFERMVLKAMCENDAARSAYLTKQAAGALSNIEGFGVEEKWVAFYNNSMTLQYGAGKYPPIASVQGFTAFLKEVYQPLAMMTLATAEVTSVMGDHAATEVVADLEAKMEIILAEKRAEVAEKVQPAQRRVDKEVMETRANEATLYVTHEEKLSRAKGIKQKLAAKAVLSPVSAGASEAIEAISEASPSLFKGFAEFLKRWQDQEGGDPKLVAVTSGGLAGGLAGGVLASFYFVNPWLFPVIAIVTPMVTSSGYMAFRGFFKK